MDDKTVINALVSALKGTTKTAAALGAKGPQVVENWRQRNYIPPAWRFAVRKLANSRAKCELPMSWLDARKVVP